MTAPVRIDLERRLPVSLHDGFDYITDPANWPEYWPRLVRIVSAERWREPGDCAGAHEVAAFDYFGHGFLGGKFRV